MRGWGDGRARAWRYGAKITGRVRLNGLLLAMGIVLMAVGALLLWRGVNLNFMG